MTDYFQYFQESLGFSDTSRQRFYGTILIVSVLLIGGIVYAVRNSAEEPVADVAKDQTFWTRYIQPGLDRVRRSWRAFRDQSTLSQLLEVTLVVAIIATICWYFNIGRCIRARCSRLWSWIRSEEISACKCAEHSEGVAVPDPTTVLNQNSGDVEQDVTSIDDDSIGFLGG